MTEPRQQAKPYSVNLWGSKPYTNDDCYVGDEFDTLAEAMEVYNNPLSYFKGPGTQSGESYYGQDCLWVELDGFTDNNGNNLIRCVNPGRKGNRDRGRREWQHEQAMEAGMLHGAEAYNEVMGYEVEEHRDSMDAGFYND